MIATTIPMAFAAAEAPTLSSRPSFTYSGGATVYFKHNNYLYKATVKNLLENNKSYQFRVFSYDYLQIAWDQTYANLLVGYRDSIAKSSNLPKSAGTSYDFYNVDSAKGVPWVTITCLEVKEPEWTWNGNKATAVFTSTDGNATMTVNASVSGVEQPVECLQQSKTLCTATATANGTTYTATNMVTGDIKQHDWGEWTTTDDTHSRTCKSNAAHTESGNHTTEGGIAATCYDAAICGVCKKSYGNPLGHKWGEGVLTRPTKTEEGYYTYTCSVCNGTKTESVESADNYTEYTEILEKVKAFLDENLTDGMMQEISDIIASFDSDASYSYIKGEEADVSQMIGQLDAFIEAVEAGIADGTAVKINGLEEIVKINDALNDELAEKYGEDALAEIAEKLDEKFADKFDELYERAEALTGSVAENKDALAEIEAEMKAIFAEAENCLAGVHNGIVYKIIVEAKCEKNAVESATCTLCGEVLERDVEGSALEHDIIIDAYKAPTCVETGLTEGQHCSRCDGATVAQDIIPALKHDIIIDEAVAGDCTNSGLTEGQHCSRCDGATIAQEVIPATGEHVDTDGDSMCDSGGEQLFCKDCGRPVHEGQINEYLCLVITFVKLVVALVNALNA